MSGLGLRAPLGPKRILWIFRSEKTAETKSESLKDRPRKPRQSIATELQIQQVPELGIEHEAIWVKLRQLILLQVQVFQKQPPRDRVPALEGLLMESLEAVAFQLQAAKVLEALEVRELGQLVVRQVQDIQPPCVGEDPGRQHLQLIVRDVKDAVPTLKCDSCEAFSVQLSQMVVLQLELPHFETFKDSSWKRGKVIVLKVQLPHFETFKDSWRQCLQLVSGHIQGAVIQLETSETLSMQLSQIVALHVQLLHFETFKDSSWKCGQAVAFQVQFSE